MKVIVDTCVILDVLQKREPFFQDSYNLFLIIASKQITGAITASSVTDIHYLMHKHFHNESKTRDSIKQLLKIFVLLDTKGADCINALVSPVADYEDAVISETAKTYDVDYIITRNIGDYKDSRVRAILPGDFLNAYNSGG